MSKKRLQQDDQQKTYIQVGNVKVPAYIAKRAEKKSKARWEREQNMSMEDS